MAGIILATMVLLASGSDQIPNAIQVIAKRYSFVPDQITVKRGQIVTLSLRSLDVTHGLTVKELGIKTDIPKGRDTVVSFTPQTVGTFVGQCSHFCGSGHGSMKFTVTVME